MQRNRRTLATDAPHHNNTGSASHRRADSSHLHDDEGHFEPPRSDEANHRVQRNVYREHDVESVLTSEGELEYDEAGNRDSTYSDAGQTPDTPLSRRASSYVHTDTDLPNSEVADDDDEDVMETEDDQSEASGDQNLSPLTPSFPPRTYQHPSLSIITTAPALQRRKAETSRERAAHAPRTAKRVRSPQASKPRTRSHPSYYGHPQPCLFKGCDHTSWTSKERHKHMDTHFPKRFKCNVCDQWFSRGSSLKRHSDQPSAKSATGCRGSWSRQEHTELPAFWSQPENINQLRRPEPSDLLYGTLEPLFRRMESKRAQGVSIEASNVVSPVKERKKNKGHKQRSVETTGTLPPVKDDTVGKRNSNDPALQSRNGRNIYNYKCPTTSKEAPSRGDGGNDSRVAGRKGSPLRLKQVDARAQSDKATSSASLNGASTTTPSRSNEVFSPLEVLAQAASQILISSRSVEVPSPKPTPGNTNPRSSGSKVDDVLNPDPDGTSAYNLCAMHWVHEHSGGTAEQFQDYWEKRIAPQERKVYETLSIFKRHQPTP